MASNATGPGAIQLQKASDLQQLLAQRMGELKKPVMSISRTKVQIQDETSALERLRSRLSAVEAQLKLLLPTMSSAATTDEKLRLYISMDNARDELLKAAKDAVPTAFVSKDVIKSIVDFCTVKNQKTSDPGTEPPPLQQQQQQQQPAAAQAGVKPSNLPKFAKIYPTARRDDEPQPRVDQQRPASGPYAHTPAMAATPAPATPVSGGNGPRSPAAHDSVSRSRPAVQPASPTHATAAMGAPHRHQHSMLTADSSLCNMDSEGQTALGAADANDDCASSVEMIPNNTSSASGGGGGGSSSGSGSLVAQAAARAGGVAMTPVGEETARGLSLMRMPRNTTTSSTNSSADAAPSKRAQGPGSAPPSRLPSAPGIAPAAPTAPAFNLSTNVGRLPPAPVAAPAAPPGATAAPTSGRLARPMRLTLPDGTAFSPPSNLPQVGASDGRGSGGGSSGGGSSGGGAGGSSGGASGMSAGGVGGISSNVRGVSLNSPMLMASPVHDAPESTLFKSSSTAGGRTSLSQASTSTGGAASRIPAPATAAPAAAAVPAVAVAVAPPAPVLPPSAPVQPQPAAPPTVVVAAPQRATLAAPAPPTVQRIPAPVAPVPLAPPAPPTVVPGPATVVPRSTEPAPITAPVDRAPPAPVAVPPTGSAAPAHNSPPTGSAAASVWRQREQATSAPGTAATKPVARPAPVPAAAPPAAAPAAVAQPAWLAASAAREAAFLVKQDPTPTAPVAALQETTPPRRATAPAPMAAAPAPVLAPAPPPQALSRDDYLPAAPVEAFFAAPAAAPTPTRVASTTTTTRQTSATLNGSVSVASMERVPSGAPSLANAFSAGPGPTASTTSTTLGRLGSRPSLELLGSSSPLEEVTLFPTVGGNDQDDPAREEARTSTAALPAQRPAQLTYATLPDLEPRITASPQVRPSAGRWTTPDELNALVATMVEEAQQAPASRQAGAQVAWSSRRQTRLSTPRSSHGGNDRAGAGVGTGRTAGRGAGAGLPQAALAAGPALLQAGLVSVPARYHMPAHLVRGSNASGQVLRLHPDYQHEHDANVSGRVSVVGADSDDEAQVVRARRSKALRREGAAYIRRRRGGVFGAIFRVIGIVTTVSTVALAAGVAVFAAAAINSSLEDEAEQRTPAPSSTTQQGKAKRKVRKITNLPPPPFFAAPLHHDKLAEARG